VVGFGGGGSGRQAVAGSQVDRVILRSAARACFELQCGRGESDVRPCHICAGTGGSPLPHLRQDWGLTPATSATGLGSSSASASLSASRASSAASSVSIARARCLLTGSGTGERCTIARARASHTQWCLNVKHACRARSSGLQNATRNAQCATASACAGRAAQRSAENARAERSPGAEYVAALRPVPVQMWQQARRHSGSGRAENTGCGLAQDGIV
jgi:hypothetical protein